MPRRSRPRTRVALVRGRQASHWLIRDDSLILRHPRGNAFTEVPIPHLVHDDFYPLHVWRLQDKNWVSPAAIEELIEIAKGASE